MGNFSNALEYADTIGDYLDYAVDIYDLFDKLTKVEVIAQMSSNYSYVLQSMSNNCNNMYLRSAINNMVLIFSKSITTQEIQYIFASKTAMNSVYTEFMKQVKKQVINSLGMVGLAVDLAQSTGTAVANSWFGTEDAISDYYQMRSLYEIEDLLRNVLLKSSGSTFCASFKMYKNICLMGCDYSKKYVGPLYTSLFGKLFAWATNQNYENYCKQLDDLKSQISFMFDMIDVGADSWYVIDTENTDNMNIVNKNFNIVKYTKDDYSNANTDIQCDIFSTYGSNRGYSVKLTKDVVVNNSFDITGGTVDLNCHKLTVNGDLTVSNGILKMTNLYDKVIVNGNFTTKSTSDHSSYLTDGTMEIKGDFNQISSDGSSVYNFNCTNNHKVIFNGTRKQSIHFDSTNSGFAKVSFKNSSIEFNSDIRGWTLQEDTVIDNDTKLNLDNTLDLNGHKLTVKGNLQQGGFTININGGTLEVQGDYTITSGYLKMTNAKDKVIVNGNFTTKSSSSHTGKLTDGTMEIKGDFNQISSDGSSVYNFNCTNNHKVIFNGTRKQSIHFDSTNSGFAKVSFKNSSIEFNSDIRGWTLQEDTVIDNDTKLNLDNTLDLNGHKLTVKGNLQQGGFTININGGTLEVQGDYTITSGYLKMTNAKDKVIVNGNFTTKSISNHTGILTDGTMEIKGNFNQIGKEVYYGYDNFNCSKNHKVIFNGTGKQIIHFDSTSSGFAKVNFKNSNIEFDNNIRGWTLQEDTVIDNNLNLNLDSDINLNGHKLTVKGSLQQGGGTININGGTLEVQGDYTITIGYLEMTNAKDKVIVGGDFVTLTSSDHSNYLTNGIMEIQGNFNQITKVGSSGYNFNCSGKHIVILNGDGTQKVKFESSNSHFNILELTKDKDTGYSFESEKCWNRLFISGDANGDEKVTVADITVIQKYLANRLQLSDERLIACDVNKDGVVTIEDATLIQKYLIHLVPSLN